MSLPAFQRDAGCLLISEVHLFFSRPGEANERDGLSALLIKHAAQPDLDGDMGDSKGLQLSQFEMAQLANLLASKDDAQLESLLNELSAIWKFA
ncbi:unnamed protein product [Malassezia sympodialis ATCC 42132]|uniref:uncharacterized protein n=1 Tax=Malassezia sympodialis (strain ATCC 42132) TaxID=1230383 RepID=UPI0002C1F4B4|nr:uncharacterized protein MSY001_1058 [Malassezia sympodialis ATCC 42132]CCU98352.1 unnamed protein product [Malassezia sympodialis ATCC 42132]|eukprot:XP_018739664.1 uncharacterized protein MSY001_1058 [Malassezia sympodialis ATCC 42132]